MAFNKSDSSRRLYGLLGVAMCSGIACARAPLGRRERPAEPAAVSSRTSAVPSGSGGAPIAAPSRLELSLRITREGETGEQTLWGELPALGIRKPIARSRAPFVCGVTVQPPNANTSSRRRATATRIDCGAGQSFLIRQDGGALLLGESVVPVPPSATLDHASIGQPLPPDRDCGTIASKPIAASIARQPSDDVTFNIPVLGISRPLVNLDREHTWYCRSTVRSLAHKMDFTCSATSFVGVTARVFLEGRVLFVETSRDATIDGQSIRDRVGFELPCNADVRLSGFFYKSPGYHAVPYPCLDACWMRNDSCSSGCDERHSDARGELDHAGRMCAAKCQEEHNACAGRCQTAGRSQP